MITQEEYDKFIAALESGEYKQTKSCLYNPVDNGYCCLGVFKVVVDNDQALLTERSNLLLAETGYAGGDLITSNDIYLDLEQRLGYNIAHDLMDKNDYGAMFTEIADYLREHKDELVKPVS